MSARGAILHALSAMQWIHRVTGWRHFEAAALPYLSLKCMFGGRARYVLDGRRELSIDDASYALVNPHVPYTVEKSSSTPVETFCVSFPAEMVSDAVASLAGFREPDEDWTSREARFLEHRRAWTQPVAQRLESLRSAHGAGDAPAVDDQLRLLLDELLSEESRIGERIACVPRVRAATRREVFVRVHRGRDFLHAHLGDTITLTGAARAADLSPHHFLRAFRAVFGLTPIQYLSRERLVQAGNLLAKTSLSVSDVAASVGFASLPSFIHAFRRQHGATPTAYRRGEIRNRR